MPKAATIILLHVMMRSAMCKRAEAEEAIARAKRRVEESEAIAEKADNLVPIEKVEALDSEDAKLRGAE